MKIWTYLRNQAGHIQWSHSAVLEWSEVCSSQVWKANKINLKKKILKRDFLKLNNSTNTGQFGFSKESDVYERGTCSDARSNLDLKRIRALHVKWWWWLTSCCRPAASAGRRWRFCCCPGDREEKTSHPCPGCPERPWTPAWVRADGSASRSNTHTHTPHRPTTHPNPLPYLAAQAKGILYWPRRWQVCLAAFSTFWAVWGNMGGDVNTEQRVSV